MMALDSRADLCALTATLNPSPGPAGRPLPSGERWIKGLFGDQKHD